MYEMRKLFNQSQIRDIRTKINAVVYVYVKYYFLNKRNESNHVL